MRSFFVTFMHTGICVICNCLLLSKQTRLFTIKHVILNYMLHNLYKNNFSTHKKKKILFYLIRNTFCDFVKLKTIEICQILP